MWWRWRSWAWRSASSRCPYVVTRLQGQRARRRPRACGPGGGHVDGRRSPASLLQIVVHPAALLAAPRAARQDRRGPRGAGPVTHRPGRRRGRRAAPGADRRRARPGLRGDLLPGAAAAGAPEARPPPGRGHRLHGRRVRRVALPAAPAPRPGARGRAVRHRWPTAPAGSDRPSPPTSRSTWSRSWPCWRPDAARRAPGCDDDRRHGPRHHGGRRPARSTTDTAARRRRRLGPRWTFDLDLEDGRRTACRRPDRPRAARRLRAPRRRLGRGGACVAVRVR